MTTTQISLPTDLLSTFRRKISAFFASQAGGESFARRPVLGLTLVVPGEPEAILEIRPTWCRWRKKLDTGTLVVDLLVNRLGHEELSRRTSHRPVELGITLSPEGERIGRRSLRYGEEGRDRLVQVVAGFLANPAASLARSKGRCCLCRRKLTDGTSVLRGYGPECARKIGSLLGFFAGEPDAVRDAASPSWDFASILSHPIEPHDDDHEDDDDGIEPDGSDELVPVPSTEPGGRVDFKLEGLDAESETEVPDPLDRYLDLESDLWCVESHGGLIRVGLPWVADTPLEVVLDDAMASISGSIEGGVTDEDDNSITDFRSFVLWKGPDVAAVATEVPTDPSRLEFTYFRA
jgi:Family of unknown function (DUF6011)